MVILPRTALWARSLTDYREDLAHRKRDLSAGGRVGGRTAVLEVLVRAVSARVDDGHPDAAASRAGSRRRQVAVREQLPSLLGEHSVKGILRAHRRVIRCRET